MEMSFMSFLRSSVDSAERRPSSSEFDVMIEDELDADVTTELFIGLSSEKVVSVSMLSVVSTWLAVVASTVVLGRVALELEA